MLVGPHRMLDPTCVAMASSGLPPAADGGIPIVGFIACGAVVRRHAFLEAGGFDPRFGVGGEEQVLSLDLLHAGWSMRYFDEVVAFHHPSLARDPAARRRRERRNALWSAWLRRHSREAWRATLEALRGGRESRAALLEALREFRWILRNRRPVRPEVERLVRAIAAGSRSASLTRDLA